MSIDKTRNFSYIHFVQAMSQIVQLKPSQKLRYYMQNNNIICIVCALEKNNHTYI